MDKLLVILADLFLGNFKSKSPVAKFLIKCAEMYHLAIDELFGALNDMFVYIQENKKDFEKICFHWTPVYLSIKAAWRETSPELKKHYLGLCNVLDLDTRMQNHPGAKKIQESIRPILEECDAIFEWNTPEPEEKSHETEEKLEKFTVSKATLEQAIKDKHIEIGVTIPDYIMAYFEEDPTTDNTNVGAEDTYRYLYYKLSSGKTVRFCFIDGILDSISY